MGMQSPLARVRGLGSARSGSHHWWVQRLTAVALAPLSLYFLWFVISSAGLEQDELRALIAKPLHASLLASFVVALFWHAQLGLQVVIEDYIHVHWQEVLLQLLVRFATLFATIVALLAIGRIAFTG